MHAGRRRFVETFESITSLALHSPLLIRLNSFLSILTISHLRVVAHILRVKIALCEAWYVRRYHLFVVYGIPVDVCAPRMVLDTADLALSYATSRVLVEHQFQKVCKLGGDELPGELKLLVERAHKHLVLVCRIEGRQTRHHLVKHGTQAVIVDSVAVRVTI